MAIELLPHRALVVASAAVGVGVAAVVYFAAPHRGANRRLALFLLAQATGLAFGWGLYAMATRPQDAFALNVIGWMAYAALVPLHLLFLASLPTPLVRPLAGRAATVALGALALALPVGIAVAPRLVVTGVQPSATAVWGMVDGPLATLIPLVHVALAMISLGLAVDLVRRSRRGGMARRQAVVYAAAFGWRDVNWLVFLLIAPDVLTGTVRIAYIAVSEIVFVAALAYGIFTAQLFDIDLRVKRGVSRGTLAAVFVAVFFVASESAQRVFEARWGPVLGLAAAGLLVLALAPLQRAADRVADRAMPGVTGSPAYVAFRKLEVYRAAYESAREGGEVTSRERDTLERLRAKLGIDPDDARAVERDAEPAGPAKTAA